MWPYFLPNNKEIKVLLQLKILIISNKYSRINEIKDSKGKGYKNKWQVATSRGHSEVEQLREVPGRKAFRMRPYSSSSLCSPGSVQGREGNRA